MALQSRVSEKLACRSQVVGVGCVECGACVKECAFLKRHGSPRKIVENYNPDSSQSLSMPFECSLCGLCTAVCPFGVDPVPLFLEMRKEAVRRGGAPMERFGRLIAYENAGISKRFTWYSIPEGCDTVFFPGCSLPGSRPDTVLWAFEKLREQIPSIGIVLDCCTKPSHDLGREEHFNEVFGELRGWLLSSGVKRVIVACPNCWKVFTDSAPGIEAVTVYEALAAFSSPSGKLLGGAVVHDSCVMKKSRKVFGAVRKLTVDCGLELTEMEHSRGKSLCCGEGGAVSHIAPEFAEEWTNKRLGEARGEKIIAYCAGCVSFLGNKADVLHVLDLLRDPEAALSGEIKADRGPVTYLNRLRLKKKLRKSFEGVVTRERELKKASGRRKSFLKFLFFFVLILAAALFARMAGLGEYLEQERLRALILSFGPLAPAIYMLLFIIGPSLSLPGLPITIVGGIVFGPFWGVVYTITSATAGACLAFLVARYLARDFVEKQLSGSRWKKLDEEVARNGWKVVAFTRLVPLFPFNLLNFALGLTKIGFWPYAITTFFCMLPACVAYVVFSSSLLDLLKGTVSPLFIAGAALVAAVSAIPFFVKKFSGRKGEGD